jgi:Flp pilus assembly protein TadD
MAWYVGVAQLERGEVEVATLSMKRALSYVPNHPHVLANLAACHERGGDHTHAAELYEQAISLAPRFHEALVNLGAVYFNAGQFKKARMALNQAADIDRTEQVDQYLTRVIEAMDQTQDQLDN